MSKETKDLIVGLDIGTSKIVALVAELTPEGRFEILGGFERVVKEVYHGFDTVMRIPYIFTYRFSGWSRPLRYRV